jgi:hypothetical protein
VITALDSTQPPPIGFKDHVGKQHSDSLDGERWLGAWNRAQEHCALATSNADCMTKADVVYPLMQPAWREVLKFIVHDRGKPVITHALDYSSAAETCYDPYLLPTPGLDSCVAVTRRHVHDFVTWANANLTAEDRRHVIIAHMGFLTDPAGEALLHEIANAGFSFDTAALIKELGDREPCAGRTFLDTYKTQVIFGTDLQADSDCLANTYEAWSFLLTKPLGTEKTFTLCGKSVKIRALDLQTENVGGCPVSQDLYNNIVRNNLLSFMGVSCPIQ